VKQIMQIKPIAAPSFGKSSVQSNPDAAKPAFVRGAKGSATAEAGLDPRTREQVANVVKACGALNLPLGQNVPAYVGSRTMALQSSTTNDGFLLQDLAKSSPNSPYPTALYMDREGRMKIDGEDVGVHSRRYGEAMRMLTAFSQSLERGGVQARQAVAEE
jgi:hypothetical protein